MATKLMIQVGGVLVIVGAGGEDGADFGELVVVRGEVGAVVGGVFVGVDVGEES